MSVNINQILADAPDNFVIQNALIQCVDVLASHRNVMCSVSGGGR